MFVNKFLQDEIFENFKPIMTNVQHLLIYIYYLKLRA